MGDGGCAEAHTTKTETKPSTEQAARPTEAPRDRHAATRALAFPLEQYFLTDRMRVFVKGGDVRVCPRGGSDVNMKNGVYLHTLRAHPRAIRAVFLPRFLGSHQHYHRP